MLHSPVQAPQVRLALRAHPPAPARVELVYQPRALRLLRVALALLLCWGPIPGLVFIPPHYPWVLGALAAGLFLAHRYWRGRYRVCSFTGSCPRCGRPLQLSRGSRISLPHTLTCFGCHHEPRLEVAREVPFPPAPLTHRAPDCPGAWGTDRAALCPTLVCLGCGARHPATPEAQHAADTENERGRLLAQLTREGRMML